MKSINFEFVRSTYPQLAEYAALAEYHLVSDPAAALVKLRMSIEYIVAQIYERWRLREPTSRQGGDPDLCDLLNCASFTRAVPKSVVAALHAVRTTGKRGAHHGYATDRDEALESLRRVHDVASWFAMSIDGAPQPEPFDASALVADTETRRALKRRLQEAQRKDASKTGEIRRLQEELAAARDDATRFKAERALGEGVANLLALPEQTAATEAEKVEAREELGACRQRILGSPSVLDMGIVVPSLACGGRASTVVTEKLTSGRHVMLVGRSGIGKSHLAFHVGAELVTSGRVVVVARARYFDGHLDDWLDVAVAPFTRHTAATLFRMAAALGERPVLLVDGLNECSQRHRDALVDNLQALLLRDAATLLVTAQTSALPFAADVVHLDRYSDSEKESIFRIHAPNQVVDKAVVNALTTPFELAIAARCASELGNAPSTYEVLAAYVRRRIPPANIDVALRLLFDLASHLSEKVAFSMPVAKLHRMAALSGSGTPEGLVQSLRDGALLHVQEGAVSFRHEMLQDFFVSELLLRQSPSTAALADRLESPRYRAALGLVLQALGSEGDLLPLLRQSRQARELIPELAAGDLGLMSEEVIYGEMKRLTYEARASLRDLRVTVQVEAPESSDVLPEEHQARAGEQFSRATRPVRRVQFTQARSWSEYEQAIFRAVGAMVHTQPGLTIARPLIEATDEAVAHAHDSAGVSRELAYHELYGVARFGPPMAASLIVAGAFSPKSSFTTIPDAAVVDLAGDPAALSPGMIFLVCRLVRNALFTEASPARREMLAGFVPALISHAWRHGFSHLKLEAMDLVRVTVSVGKGAVVEKLKAAVEAIGPTGDVWLNTAWIEAAVALGMVEPSGKVDDIRRQIVAVIENPSVPEARAWACVLYANQLEDLVANIHIEAIADLKSEDRLRLWCMAALGEDHPSISLELCLRELVEHPQATADPLAAEAIKKWSPPPQRNETFPDQAVGAFLCATLGRAVLDLGPYQAAGPVGSTEAAWLAWGEVLYWTTASNLDAETRAARTLQAWTHLRENATDAVEPFYWLDKHQRFESLGSRKVWFALIDAWPSEFETLLETAAGRLDEISSAFSFRHPDVPRFVVSQLCRLPRARAQRLLEPLVDRTDVGEDAIRVLKQFGERREGP